MGEFSMRDFVSPGTWIASAEDPKVGFNLLIDMFCLTVRLGMIGGGEREVVIEKSAKFFGKDRGKL